MKHYKLIDTMIHCPKSAGSAYNQDGRSSGLTAPNGPAQTALVRTALATAAASPSAVRLVSMHGTGTPLGDPIEVNALGQAVADQRPHHLTLGAFSENLNFDQIKNNICSRLNIPNPFLIFEI